MQVTKTVDTLAPAIILLLALGGGGRPNMHPIPSNADPRERVALALLLPHVDGSVLWNENGRVREIDIVGDAVTSDDIKAIAILSDLEALQLMAPLKDDDLASLESLQRLKTLDLWWTPIDDAGVERLSKMDKLKWLRLSHTKISAIDALGEGQEGLMDERVSVPTVRSRRN